MNLIPLIEFSITPQPQQPNQHSRTKHSDFFPLDLRNIYVIQAQNHPFF